MKSRLGWVAKDDGIFWMCLEDFVVNFASLYVCKLPSSGWHEAVVRSEWKGPSAGGCANNRFTHKNNPAFRLLISRPTHVLVALAQDDMRGAERSELFPIGMQLLRPGLLNSRVQGAETGAYINLREVSFDAQLTVKGGEKTEFLLRPSTFEAGQECAFTLRVYSSEPVEFEQIGGQGRQG
jgi:hypothetical protein